MFENNKIIWSEGMFLRPQHFQQHDRYIENLVENRCRVLQPYGWGFYSLTIDADLFAIGKLAIKSCRGLFPDGTPFCLPEHDALPPPLDLPTNCQNEILYLALPVRQAEALEADIETRPDGLARYRLGERDVKDTATQNGTTNPVQVGVLKTRLLRESDERSGYTCLGIARVIEVKADKRIIVDERYIPTNLNCYASPQMRGFITELHGLLNTRAETIAGMVADAGNGGVAEIADFLLLQLINRNQLLFNHLSTVTGLHPESFYRTAIQLVGELATFFRPDKRPQELPAYHHEELTVTFAPLMDTLRQLLGKPIIQRAVRIALKGPQYGIYAAVKPDLSLLRMGVFILAVKAELPSETIRQSFPRQIKIGPTEEINRLVRTLTPGIALEPLAMTPRQIPYHAGFTYFELNKNSELWRKLETSGGFAFHVDADIAGLQLEFWAIRGG